VHIQGFDERVDLKNYGGKEQPGLKGMKSEKDK
jgi:hypothetical protein